VSTLSSTREALRAGEFSAAELLADHLKRIHELNGELNAIITLCEERATQTANSADEGRSGREGRLLEGIPFSVKDVIPVAGVRMTAGSRLFDDHVPAASAPVVDRLEAAGAILVGKANCPEFGLDPHTDNLLFGATKNPIDATKTPGGSSGGDAAAVAADFVSFGIGSDYGGSIRWPAHCTGTVGFRPTPGLVPGTGHFPFIKHRLPTAPNSASFFSRTQTIAPIARSVEDAWIVVSVIAGPDGVDPLVSPVALGSPASVTVSDLRTAWAGGDGSASATSEVVDAVKLAGALLSDMGMDVVEQAPPGLEECESIYARHRAADGLDLHRDQVVGREELLTSTMRTWFDKVIDASVGDVLAIATERDRVRASVLSFMETTPILVLPVANRDAFTVGAADFDERFRALTPSRAVSLLGLPSCAVPVSTSAAGMPLAVQVVGRPFHDHEVAAVAMALEGVLSG